MGNKHKGERRKEGSIKEENREWNKLGKGEEGR